MLPRAPHAQTRVPCGEGAGRAGPESPGEMVVLACVVGCGFVVACGSATSRVQGAG